MALKATVEAGLKKTPDDAHLCYLEGAVCMDGADDEEAAKWLDKAVTLDPKNAAYLKARGMLFLFQKKPAEAVGYIKRAAEAAPAEAASWTTLAMAQMDARQFDDARNSLEKAVAMEPANPRYVAMVGEVWLADGKPAERSKQYQKAVEVDPAYVKGYMNIGQLEQTAGHFAESLAAYEKGLKLAPDDWRAWAKVVQLYAVLGEDVQRDAARDKVFALFKAGKVSDPMYCREQFTHAGKSVMVFEYFELKGERAVRYSFNILSADGAKVVERVSLGSYEQTTAMAREAGTIKGDERIYHLDTLLPDAHKTLGMFKQEPGYAEVRKMVEDYLDGKLPAASSTQFEPATQKGP